ncbi:MAG TPA: hypothetical protein VLB85_00890 [Acidimicrobiia bacterium]|nr:hypothetical protein [Acidimicrobiia bacterium]
MDIEGPRGWHITDVRVASTGPGRLRGLIGHPLFPLLLATSSVHGFHLSTELTVVALDRAGVVLTVRRLRPWRVIRVRGASWMLELPRRVPGPRVGDRLQLRGRSGESGG